MVIVWIGAVLTTAAGAYLAFTDGHRGLAISLLFLGLGCSLKILAEDAHWRRP